MSAHTPGPWSVVGHVVKSCDGQTNIAHVTQMMGDGPGVAAANGRLIAAAPELLDALVDATGTLKGCAEALRGVDAPRTAAMVEARVESLMALLVKATKP